MYVTGNNIQQHRQYTYKVTSWGVSVTIVATEMKQHVQCALLK
jgi:hypothetical protein